MEKQQSNFILLIDVRKNYCLVGINKKFLNRIESEPLRGNFSIATEVVRNGWGYEADNLSHYNVEFDSDILDTLLEYRFRGIISVAEYCNWNNDKLQGYLNAQVNLTEALLSLNEINLEAQNQITILKA